MDKKDIKSLTIKVDDRKYSYKFRGDSIGEWVRCLYSVYGKLVVNEMWGTNFLGKTQSFLEDFYKNNKDMKKNTFKLMLKVKGDISIQGDYNKESFEIKNGEIVEIITPSFAKLSDPIMQKRGFITYLNMEDTFMGESPRKRIPSQLYEIVKLYVDKYIELLKQLHYLEYPELGK